MAIDRGLDLWAGTGSAGPPGSISRAVNAAASALAADLSGDPWQTFHGPVVICGVELGESGEEHAVGLAGERLVALRRRIGRHRAE
ncbi:hypothetical protein GT755_29530 [Herbidospora sp. NEAU-GS84]|uniref:Uncharacterized protein n=1 Tax=Herbidospora solisilvae TaxID=2696284 RepID=A0A7C9N3Y5_9ACTN|nr:hypothetical protein [Herbidospora solisilvae]NAS25810.1 hypothetical protein [Herbidospora solisilvae]